MPSRVASRRVLIAACSLVLLAACGKKENSPSTEKAVVPEAKLPTLPAEVPLASTLEVETFLSKWLQTQNEGKFDDYSALYAKKFTGIKRSAERERKFNREDWLSDRAGMFKKPFTVGTAKVQINTTPGVVIVFLEQRWKSDSYEDSGEKQILLVREDDRLVISREVMRSSRAVGAEELSPPSFEQAALVRKTLGSFALLIPGPVDLNWAIDHPVYISDEHNERAVSLQAVPASKRALLDNSYEVFDESGQPCQVKPKTLKIMTYVIPHFGTVNYWNDFGAEYEGRKPEPQPPAARALSLWGLGGSRDQGRTLALEYEANPSCPRPVWGRKVTTDAPTPARVRAAREDELKEVAAVLRSHPVVKELDSELRRTHLEPKGWSAALLPGTARVVEMGNGAEFVYVEASGLGGCGYSAPESVGLLWRRQNGRLTPDARPLYFEGNLRAAVDLNGDNELELMGDDVILSRRKAGYSAVVDHSPLFLDCGC